MSASGRTAFTRSSAASPLRGATTSSCSPKQSRQGAATRSPSAPSRSPPSSPTGSALEISRGLRQLLPRRGRPMTEPTVVTLADPEACALAAAERIVEILDVVIDDRGEAHWVTTGGSAPAKIYHHLAT